MKKRKPKTRSIIYSGVGVFLAMITTAMMLIQVPAEPNASTKLEHFSGGLVKTEDIQNENTEIQKPSDYSGVQINGYLLGDNTYHIGESELKNYIANKVMRTGRWNPMLYRKAGQVEEIEIPTSPENTIITEDADKAN